MESELGPRGSVLKPGENLVGRKGVLPLHFLEGPTGSQAVALGAQRPAAAPSSSFLSLGAGAQKAQECWNPGPTLLRKALSLQVHGAVTHVLGQ